MKEAIAKAKTLIEAMSYIQRYVGKTVVIKMGGSVMDNPLAMSHILMDVVFMSTVGIRPVIVHGGGKAISSAMEERGLEVQFVQGRRYTDLRSLNVVEHVLCNEVNRRIVEQIEKFGATAMGIHTLSGGVLFGEKYFMTSDDGRKVDLGFVGRVTSVNAKLIDLLCKAGTIAVLAPLARDKTGAKLNCNADNAAGEVAAALQAEKFVLVTDTHGIRRDLDDENSVMSRLNVAEIKTMIADGTIAGGMLPKVDACLTSLAGGVKRTHIIDGGFQHSLLLEIFSDSGVGTLIEK